MIGKIPDFAISVNRNATRDGKYDIYRCLTPPVTEPLNSGMLRCRHNPWRAPGYAPVADACGLAGGTPWGGDAPEEGRYENTVSAFGSFV